MIFRVRDLKVKTIYFNANFKVCVNFKAFKVGTSTRAADYFGFKVNFKVDSKVPISLWAPPHAGHFRSATFRFA